MDATATDERFEPIDATKVPRFADAATFMHTRRHALSTEIGEVAPYFDPTGITCVTAANLMFEMPCVIADWRGASGPRATKLGSEL